MPALSRAQLLNKPVVCRQVAPRGSGLCWLWETVTYATTGLGIFACVFGLLHGGG